MTKFYLSYKLDGNKLIWYINDVKFIINYNFDVDVKYIKIFGLIPLIYTICLMTVSKIRPQLYIENDLSQEDILFISEYYNLQYITNRVEIPEYDIFHTTRRKILINGDRISLNVNAIKQLKNNAISTHDDNPSKAVASWSGGKDSLLTIRMLNECNVQTIPCVTKWNTIAFNRGANVFLNNHEIKPVVIASTALNHNIKHLFLTTLKDNGIDIKNQGEVYNSMSKSLPNKLYHSAFMNTQLINNVLYALHNNIGYSFTGDEADTNNVVMYGDSDMPYVINIGQSYRNKQLINAYINSIIEGDAANAYSLLYPIRSPLEHKILLERYKDINYSSCLTMINKWCNKCPKCVVSTLYLYSIGYNPEILGIDVDKVVKNYKREMTDSFLSADNDTAYWMFKRIYNIDKIKRITTSYMTELPDNYELNPLMPISSKYKTIPKFCRKQVVKIYEKHSEQA